MAKTKGIIVELGGDATGLNKAISSVSKEARDTQRELKQIEKLLKMDPGNINLLKQKQELLNESISETENFVTALKKAKEKADEDMANGTEINKEQYRELERQIISNEQQLRSLKEQADAVNDSLVDVNGDSFVILEKRAKSAAEILEESFNSGSSEIRDLNKELKDVNKLLDMDPHNVTFVEQQFEILQETVWEAEKRLKALNEVQEKADFGEISLGEKEYRKLVRQIAEAEAELNDASEAARLASMKISAIQDGSLIDAKNAAKDVAAALNDAESEAADFGDVLKANMIGEAAGKIVDSLQGVAEETREYRKIMGSLEVSSEQAGYTADQTGEAYKRLYGVLSDDQSTATTLANLQALELSQDELLKLIDNVIGGWAKYGDSIPIDGLAEAVNETIRTGQVTGNLADILNWGAREGETYGVKMREATEANEEWNASVEAAETAEDFFNLALQECSTEAERANLVMQAMADQGLGGMAEKWRENNEAMVEANEVNAEMQDQLAQLGERLEPLQTRLTTMVLQVLEWFNSLDEGTQNFIIGTVLIIAAIGPVVSAFGGIATGITNVMSMLPQLQNVFTTVFGFITANPVSSLIAAILALVVYVVSTNEEIQANLAALGSAIVQILTGIIDFVTGVFTGNWQQAWNGIVQIFGGIFSGVEAIAATVINTVIGLINTAIDGINWLISKINMIPGVDVSGVNKIPMMADGGTLLSGSAIVGEAGPELLTVSGGKAVVQPLSANTGRIEGLLGDINSQLAGGSGWDFPFVVQVTLDGKVVGESAVQYIRRSDRGNGK